LSQVPPPYERRRAGLTALHPRPAHGAHTVELSISQHLHPRRGGACALHEPGPLPGAQDRWRQLPPHPAAPPHPTMQLKNRLAGFPRRAAPGLAW
jgi:hypothetical protein